MDFKDTFKSLTGNLPFPWQEALYHRFISDRSDNIPSSCNLPTGLGKTSVVAVWLIALAQHPDRVPRRLVYVVNRRTVVDQTTSEVEKYRAVIQAEPALHVIRGQLAALCALPLRDKDDKSVSPLALSTLRGQFADNREWSADPARPAVIAGTVDMIGSRLLFSGYGVGFKGKPLHAGFLGQDVLLVHDEAHLEPAFQKLLIGVEAEQKRCKEFREFRVMELSATSRSDESAFVLTDEEQNPPQTLPEPPTEPIHFVWRRQRARKAITLHKLDDEKKDLADMIAKLAQAEHTKDRAVLVFVRKVDDVEKIVKQLPKGTTQQLTGTLRGLERDRMADPRMETGCPIFARFLKRPKPDAAEAERWNVEPKTGTVYFVCTSAGEVGVNISADHMVCDLSTFESMAQRFGRVNRFGDRDDTVIHVLYPKDFDKSDKLDQRRSKTLDLLVALNGDGSPKALGELASDDRLAAFAPTPTILPTSDILFDAWALTTIRGKLPGRPPVEPYLHGISEWEPPATRVAWREEVWELRLEFDSEEDRKQREQFERNRLGLFAAELLEDYPIKPHELLRDRSDRVFKHLAVIAGQCPDHPAWLLDDDGSVEPFTLSQLADKDKKERINNRTILLPPNAGGLLIEKGESRGMLTGSSNHEPEFSDCYDVADDWCDADGPRRVRVWDNDKIPNGMRRIRTVTLPPSAEDAEGRKWYWFERLTAGDSDGSKASKLPVAWQVHTDDVKTNAEHIVKGLPLPDELKAAIIVAAKFHDLGKQRMTWQRDIGNDEYPAKVLAKSGGRMKPRNLGSTYRHEFGSLVDLLDQKQPHFAEFKNLTDDMQEVVLHLIAVHHGFGRPHFPTDYAFDPEPKGIDVEHLATEVPQRFARLQRKYGRWGLAFLESLLRAADYAASANPSAFVECGPTLRVGNHDAERRATKENHPV